MLASFTAVVFLSSHCFGLKSKILTKAMYHNQYSTPTGSSDLQLAILNQLSHSVAKCDITFRIDSHKISFNYMKDYNLEFVSIYI